MLLDLTQNEVFDLGAQCEARQRAVRECAARLSAATSLINMLLRCRYALDERDRAVLQSHLSPLVDDTWEEQTDAAMMQLLRTTLAKTARDQSVLPQALAMPADTQRLCKHIALVCERVAKGMKLARADKEKEKKRSDSGGAAAAAGAAPVNESETVGS